MRLRSIHRSLTALRQHASVEIVVYHESNLSRHITSSIKTVLSYILYSFNFYVTVVIFDERFKYCYQIFQANEVAVFVIPDLPSCVVINAHVFWYRNSLCEIYHPNGCFPFVMNEQQRTPDQFVCSEEMRFSQCCSNASQPF